MTPVSRLFPAAAKARTENLLTRNMWVPLRSGDGDDAKKYQDKQVKRAIEEVTQ
jgi:hypothetical protein